MKSVRKVFLIIFLLTICILAVPGCGKVLEEGDQENAQKDIVSSDNLTTENNEETLVKKDASNKFKASVTESGDEDKNENKNNSGNKGVESTVNRGALTFAERACGKYSCKNDEGECYIIEITRFGSNLLAYGGVATEDGGNSLEAYSFWAMELIPESREEILSVDSNSCNVGILTFSVMSNASQYWSEPSTGILRIVDNGIILDGFDENCPFYSNDVSILFFDNYDVEDTFPYMIRKSDASESELTGLWCNKDKEKLTFIEFTAENNIRFYQKINGEEAKYICGNADFSDKGKVSGICSSIEGGAMPIYYDFDYKLSGSDLELKETEESDAIFEILGLKGNVTLNRTEESNIPVTILSDVYDAESNEDIGCDEYNAKYGSAFYGVWTSAVKDMESANEALDKLVSAGFNDAVVIYSSDWEKLNSEPYLCVSAGVFESEEDAKETLDKVRSAGYKDAYVKFTGERKYVTALYTVSDLSQYVQGDDSILIKDVGVRDKAGNNIGKMDLIVDKKTKFAADCDIKSFSNHAEGESILMWMTKNLELSNEDGDAYSAAGMPIHGVFEVTITDGHIDLYYGCYWWD